MLRNPTDYIVDEAISWCQAINLTQNAVSNLPEGEITTKEYVNLVVGIYGLAETKWQRDMELIVKE